MPESNQPPPQPLDYDSPQSAPPHRPRLIMCVAIALTAFLAFLAAAQFGLIPAPQRSHSMRVISAANLRSIGLACLQYANDNYGQYPDSLATLLLNEDITSGVFINPASDDTPAVAPTTQAIANQLTAGGHLSYVYLGRGLTAKTVTPDTIVAHELLLNPTDGANVLFGDGHVEYVDNAYIKTIIAKTATGPLPVTMPPP
jgi:prepilin-type processing-associated H-X9-DG protein